MKVIVAGGRDFIPTRQHYELLKDVLMTLNTTEEVCGGARGADEFGQEVAEHLAIPVKMFPADWDRYGKSAGYKRNEEMAQYADACVLFPGGKGTEHMRNLALKKGMKIIDYTLGGFL